MAKPSFASGLVSDLQQLQKNLAPSSSPGRAAPDIPAAPPPVKATPIGPPAPPPAQRHPAKPKTKQTRRALLDWTIQQVHGGQLTEAQGEKVLRGAGFPDSHNPFAQAHTGGVTGIAGGAARALGYHSTYGLPDTSQFVSGKDGLATYNLAQPPRKPELVQVPTHVNAGVVGVGPGAAFGLGRQIVYQVGQGAVYAPAGGVSLVTDPGKTLGQLKEHLLHPNPADAAFLGYLGAFGAATGISRGLAAGRALKAGEGLRTAATRSSLEGGSLLHTPRAQPIPITIPGHRLEGPPTKEGVLPREQGVTFERPVIQNPLVRPVSRARSRAIQKALNKETPARELGIPIRGTRVGAGIEGKLRGTFSPVATAGRELRAEKRVRLEITNAHANDLRRITRKLSPAERDAVTVVAIAGEQAFTNPAATIDRLAAAHEHWAALGGDPTRNIEHIGSLRKAEETLANPSPQLLRAIAQSKQVSDATTQKLIDAGLLDPAAAAGRQQKVAEMYGFDQPPSGSFYFPLAERYQNLGIQPAGAFETRPSMYGTGPPSMNQRIGGLTAPMTGAQITSGRLPVAGEALATRGTQVNNALEVRNQYDNLYRIGHDTRRSVFDIPVRDTSRIQDELRQFFSDLSRQDLAGSVDAADKLAEANLTKLLGMIDGGVMERLGGIRPGSPASRIDGVRWVDRRLIAPSAPSIKGGIFKAADAITNPIRVTQLYARPAYILNLAGNLGMNGIADGARMFPALRKAATWQKTLPEPVMREIDGGMGVSLSRSYSVGRGFGGQLSDKMAEFWNRITDMHSRRSAFFAEAAREGFKTEKQVADLMTDPANEATRMRVFRQANKNIVDYSSLTPFERDEVRRLIYFYPWVSRGTIWSLRAMVEHPVKAFTLFELGQIGAENAHKQLGQHLPAWVEQLGLIPVGHSGDRTKVINPSSVWTPTTAVQAFSAGLDTAKAALGVQHPMGGLGEVLTPAATLFTQASSRYQGGPTASGLLGLGESLPFYQAVRRAGLTGAQSHTYPQRDVWQALGPLLVGGFFPRPMSRSAVGLQAVTQATTPKAKLLIQIDQMAEQGILTPERAALLKARAEGWNAEAVKRARRIIGPYLKPKP